MKYRIFLGLVLGLLVGCSSAAVGQTEGVKGVHMIPSPSAGSPPKTGIKKAPKPNLILVLCSENKLKEAEYILKKHQFLVIKQTSPTVLLVSWENGQSLKVAKETLLDGGGVFCHAQENYEYHTM